MNFMVAVLPISSVLFFAAAVVAPLHTDAIKDVMGDQSGAFVLIDCASREIAYIDSEASGKRLPPCSTFKIWNALLDIEEVFLTDAAEPFYQWDGVKRWIEGWNSSGAEARTLTETILQRLEVL